MTAPKSDTPIEEILEEYASVVISFYSGGTLPDGKPAPGMSVSLMGKQLTLDEETKEALKQIESYYQNLYLGRLPEKQYPTDSVTSSVRLMGFNQAIDLMESAIKGRENE